MNKNIPDAYDYDDPIDRPMIDEQRDEQECKHEETRHLYADHIESRKSVAHDCDMIICCDCGATIADCLDSTELCDECQLTREDCGEEGECEGMHDRITKCSCIRCEKEARDE